MTFIWSKKAFIIGLLYSAVVISLSHFSNFDFYIPWQPIGVIGVAVAFYLGFKNNSSYDRTWEARKIYGGIVNDSRSFGASAISFVKGDGDEAIVKELIYRHIAWLTSLRHQLRLAKPWEHSKSRLTELYMPTICESYDKKLNNELKQYLSDEEIEKTSNKANRATQILKLQSIRLQELRDQGYFEDFRHMELHRLITNMYTGQGKAERIKNFPFPRQYASTALWVTFVFCALVPLGLIVLFRDSIWTEMFCVFISAVIIWIFFLMEKIGDYSENPFEGTFNDVPITSISIGIEIDLREMINDENIPKPMQAENGFLL